MWLQRASDIVRRIRAGDIDVGFVGYDMVYEYGEGDDDIVVVHDALGYGHCHLALAVPTEGRWADVSSLADLVAMPDWTPATPLKVVTGYTHIARDWFAKVGFDNYELCSADGALEAAPKMGYADIILDLVSTGTTLRENNLKEIADARMVESQGCLVASRKALRAHPGLLAVVRELVERLEANLKAKGYYTVTVNVRGSSADEVARLLTASPALSGLAGPTVSPVYAPGATQPDTWACVVSVPKKDLYRAVKELRALGGSGVLVSPMTYIFDEEPARWRALLDTLGVDAKEVPELLDPRTLQ